jgi:hypothetical protein
MPIHNNHKDNDAQVEIVDHFNQIVTINRME